MKCPFEMSWEIVTPALATLWLKEHNTHNRPLRQATVHAFASDMSLGKWAPTHQGIAFGIDGVLKDGQHRLAAIVTSGKSIWMWVARGVPDFVEDTDQGGRVMEAIDRGNSRSIADLLRLDHGMKANPNIAAAICLQIARCVVRFSADRTKKATMPQTVAILELFRPSIEWAMNTLGDAPRNLKSAQVFGSLAVAFHIQPEATAAFARALITGAGLHEGAPALTLRNEIFRDGCGGSASERKETGWRILHAIWLYIENKPLVRSPRSEFPGAVWFQTKLGDLVDKVEKLFPPLEDPGAVKRERAKQQRAAKHESTKPDLIAPVRTVAASNWKPTAAAERLLSKK